VQPQFLPTPARGAREVHRLTRNPFVGYTLQQHLLSSFGRFVAGFALAAIVGIPLGLMMGWYRWLDDIVTPLFERCASSRRSRGCRSPRCGSAPGSAAGADHLQRRVSAVPHQRYRGARFVETRYIEAAQTLGAPNWRDHLRSAAARSVPSIVAACASARDWLAVADRRRADRRSSGIGYLMVKGRATSARRS
jgi:NitT/TauT family transport system permease protein